MSLAPSPGDQILTTALGMAFAMNNGDRKA